MDINDKRIESTLVELTEGYECNEPFIPTDFVIFGIRFCLRLLNTKLEMSADEAVSWKIYLTDCIDLYLASILDGKLITFTEYESDRIVLEYLFLDKVHILTLGNTFSSLAFNKTLLNIPVSIRQSFYPTHICETKH